jgi:hypothetical protein
METEVSNNNAMAKLGRAHSAKTFAMVRLRIW